MSARSEKPVQLDDDRLINWLYVAVDALVKKLLTGSVAISNLHGFRANIQLAGNTTEPDTDYGDGYTGGD